METTIARAASIFLFTLSVALIGLLSYSLTVTPAYILAGPIICLILVLGAAVLALRFMLSAWR